MIDRLTTRDQRQFFASLSSADCSLAAAWWMLLVLRGVLPAFFAIAIGLLVGSLCSGARAWCCRWL